MAVDLRTLTEEKICLSRSWAQGKNLERVSKICHEVKLTKKKHGFAFSHQRFLELSGSFVISEIFDAANRSGLADCSSAFWFSSPSNRCGTFRQSSGRVVSPWHFRLDGALGGSRLFVVSWLGDDSAAVLIMGRKSMKHGGHTGN